MRLATIFKTALVTAGLGLSTLGGGMVWRVTDDAAKGAPPEQSSGPCARTIANDALKFGLMTGGTCFFAGTTLVATGLRRQKNPARRSSL